MYVDPTYPSSHALKIVLEANEVLYTVGVLTRFGFT